MERFDDALQQSNVQFDTEYPWITSFLVLLGAGKTSGLTIKVRICLSGFSDPDMDTCMILVT